MLAIPFELTENHVERADFCTRFRNAAGVWRRYAVFLRHGAREFLKWASERYELVLFTAAERRYADPIVDALESGERLFSHRLYREHCIAAPVGKVGTPLKSLRAIGDRRYEQCMLVDDNPLHLEANKDRSVHVKPFVDPEKNDEELAILEILLGVSTIFS